MGVVGLDKMLAKAQLLGGVQKSAQVEMMHLGDTGLEGAAGGSAVAGILKRVPAVLGCVRPVSL